MSLQTLLQDVIHKVTQHGMILLVDSDIAPINSCQTTFISDNMVLRYRFRKDWDTSAAPSAPLIRPSRLV